MFIWGNYNLKLHFIKHISNNNRSGIDFILEKVIVILNVQNNVNINSILKTKKCIMGLQKQIDILNVQTNFENIIYQYRLDVDTQ